MLVGFSKRLGLFVEVSQGAFLGSVLMYWVWCELLIELVCSVFSDTVLRKIMVARTRLVGFFDKLLVVCHMLHAVACYLLCRLSSMIGSYRDDYGPCGVDAGRKKG